IARLAQARDLIELGSGSSTKTRLLIEAGLTEGSLERYIPVEVSQEIAEQSARALVEAYPELSVHAVVGDFEKQLGRIPSGGRRMVAFLGSTIGNFRSESAVVLLSQVPALLPRGGFFLLGTDLVKDKSVLEAAYNDSQGVTARFNLNILNVINRNLDGDFDPRAFAHVSFYNEEEQRIESYVQSRRNQTVRLNALDLEVSLEEGERIRTEVSCKYTRRSVERLLERAGLNLEHWFTDPAGNFALSLSHPARREKWDRSLLPTGEKGPVAFFLGE
ncbi:MAG: L-histidine N(alpha)-methyltransferase, partial [Thermoleophilia bacterium]|nr:L-histidine N(alpha)-methyltransferase [Thermoleophilia bacterium]